MASESGLLNLSHSTRERGITIATAAYRVTRITSSIPNSPRHPNANPTQALSRLVAAITALLILTLALLHRGRRTVDLNCGLGVDTLKTGNVGPNLGELTL